MLVVVFALPCNICRPSTAFYSALTFNQCSVLILNSAKSRIKGTLEIYHAFIRETREPSEPSGANSDGEWEHVEATTTGEVTSQPVREELYTILIPHLSFPFSDWLLIFALFSIHFLVAVMMRCPLAGKRDRTQMDAHTMWIIRRARRNGRGQPCEYRYAMLRHLIQRLPLYFCPSLSSNNSQNVEQLASDFQRRFHISVDETEPGRGPVSLMQKQQQYCMFCNGFLFFTFYLSFINNNCEEEVLSNTITIYFYYTLCCMCG